MSDDSSSSDPSDTDESDTGEEGDDGNGSTSDGEGLDEREEGDAGNGSMSDGKGLDEREEAEVGRESGALLQVIICNGPINPGWWTACFVYDTQKTWGEVFQGLESWVIDRKLIKSEKLNGRFTGGYLVPLGQTERWNSTTTDIEHVVSNTAINEKHWSKINLPSHILIVKYDCGYRRAAGTFYDVDETKFGDNGTLKWLFPPQLKSKGLGKMKQAGDEKRQRVDSGAVNRLAAEFDRSCKLAENSQIADELQYYKWDELAHNFDGEPTKRDLKLLNLTNLDQCVGGVYNKNQGRIGTCFAISPKALLTCWHVIKDTEVTFKMQGIEVEHAKAIPFEKFDIALIPLMSTLGAHLTIEMEPNFINPERHHACDSDLFTARFRGDQDKLYVVSGLTKGFGLCYIWNTLDMIRYDSGCPILNEKGRVIGIHRKPLEFCVFKKGYELTAAVRLDAWLGTSFLIGTRKQAYMEIEKEKKNWLKSAFQIIL